MLKKLTYLLVVATMLIVFVGFRSKYYSFQPPANHSGAPDGAGLCSDCHGNLNSGGGSVVINGLPANFQPGVTYPFSVTISHPSSRQRWGFEVNARNANGAPAGIFASTNPNAEINSGPAEIAHYDAVFSSGTTYTYNNLTWTAPASIGPGGNRVNFYVAGNAANGNFNLTGDFIYTNATQISLPVTLKSFDYIVSGYSVALRWTTATEQNSKEFVVEKSEDNTSFYAAGRVSANGSSPGEKNYSFNDDKPTQLNKPVFYRLKLVDQDNSYTYSKTLRLTVKGEPLVVKSVYPNPADDHTTVEIFADQTTDAMLLVYGANGKMVLRQSLSLQSGKNNHKLSLAALQSGNYFLYVKTGTHSQKVSFVKL